MPYVHCIYRLLPLSNQQAIFYYSLLVLGTMDLKICKRKGNFKTCERKGKRVQQQTFELLDEIAWEILIPTCGITGEILEPSAKPGSP